jgi:hypothetical protein
MVGGLQSSSCKNLRSYLLYNLLDFSINISAVLQLSGRRLRHGLEVDRCNV